MFVPPQTTALRSSKYRATVVGQSQMTRDLTKFHVVALNRCVVNLPFFAFLCHIRVLSQGLHESGTNTNFQSWYL